MVNMAMTSVENEISTNDPSSLPMEVIDLEQRVDSIEPMENEISTDDPSSIPMEVIDFEQRVDSIQPLEIVENEQSPFEEVAANVSNKDDPSMAALTFRSWFLGIAFTCVLSFVNQFFWYRTSPLIIGVLVAQLLSHLLGKAMAKVLPRKTFKIFRWRFTLNPGPFTVKEHCIITTMASTGCVSRMKKDDR